MKTCETCGQNSSWITADDRLYCWDCVMGFGISARHIEDDRTPSAKEINDWFERQKVSND